MWNDDVCLPFRSTCVHPLISCCSILVFCVLYCTSLFGLFLLVIVWYVLLQITDSDGTFKLCLLISVMVDCGIISSSEVQRQRPL